MVSASSGELRETNTMPVLDGREALVRSAVIYGPNASGKTNLLRALYTMQKIVLESAQAQRGQMLPITPYLGNNTDNTPTEFEVMFIYEGVRYQYGFLATHLQIMEEWLLAYPKRRAQAWIERTYDQESGRYEWKHSDKFVGPKAIWQEATRDNALFLSTAVQLNNAQLQPVFDWFRTKVATLSTNQIPMLFTLDYSNRPKGKQDIVEFLQSADFAISDIRIQRKKLNAEALGDEVPEAVRAVEDLERIDLTLFHLGQDKGHLFELDFNEESDGTQRFFRLAGPWLDVLQEGRILCVDELNAHLHPLLVQYLVEMFHNQEKNPNNAQLIFTTHETSILNQELFRRDQIWFTEKDKYNATTLYPLTDFRPRKGVENLERGYLQGRYGALPYFHEITSLMEDVKAENEHG